MAKFDRIDGQFVAVHCTYGERLIFDRAGWAYNRMLKRWTTTKEDAALAIKEHAVGAAKEYLDNIILMREEAVAASWAEDTDSEFPAPEGLSYMPFQKAGIEYAIDGDRTLIADPPGLGKAQPVDEPILTPNGWKPIGKLRPGDYVIGSDGTPTKISGVFPQGLKPTYEITFRDGAQTRCCDEHLWAVRDTNRRKRKQSPAVKSLREICDRGLQTSDGKNKWDIPLVSSIQFPEKPFQIPAYTMGILLGDGCMTGTTPVISIPDWEMEIHDRVQAELHEGYRMQPHGGDQACTQYMLSRDYCGPTPSIYMDEIRRLNLAQTAKNKHIPAQYFLGSAEQRLELLRGLMDSDGAASKNRITFHTVSPQLAKDVQQLVWSLAGSATVRKYDRTHEGKSVEYHVNVKMLECPFHLERKVAEWWPSDRNGPRRFIENVQYVGETEQVCISVEAADRLYITRDYTVTHNTIQAIGVHNVLECDRILVVCPASLKVNWSREWRKWDVHGRSVGIAVSIPERYKVEEYDENTEEYVTVTRTRTRHDWPDTDVVIINYDMLFSFDDYVKATEWDLMICDEAHLLKTKTAIRTMCIFGGQKKARKKDGKVVEKAKTLVKIKATSHLYLTGTPILSKPAELWTLIRACDPKGLGKDWERYAYTYCEGEMGSFGLDSSGASNLDELGRILRERFMIRRDKQAVLKELPPKTREVIVLPQDKLERVIRKERSRVEDAMDDFEAMMGVESTAGEFRYIAEIDNLSDRLTAALAEQESEEPDWNRAVKSLTPPEQLLFTELSEAREEVALGKVKLVVDHVKKLIECEEPVILFAHHKSVIEEIHKALEKAGISVGIITGMVASDKRQDVVDDFQEGRIDVILGNIFAMGVGLTMTRGRFVVFAELDWTPALIEQAEDRAWRHGQKNAVMVQYLIVDGSIEAQLAQTILAKMGVIFEALDAVSC